MAKAQRKKLEKSEWYGFIGAVLALASIGLTLLGSWTFIAAGIALWPFILLMSLGYKKEKMREEAHGTPRDKLNSEWKARPEDAPR